MSLVGGEDQDTVTCHRQVDRVTVGEVGAKGGAGLAWHNRYNPGGEVEAGIERTVRNCGGLFKN